MANQPAPEKIEPIAEDAMQQMVLQQAQAAAAAQIPSRTANEEPLLQHTDLITRNEAEGDIPPPAYGEVYGEIRGEKNGIGSSAAVTGDGRVNIRINQLNRRLSQVFTPALHQHLRDVQESAAPPPAYIPPSLGGDEGASPPPSLNIVIQVVGSRGDVQPFIALGKVLKDTYGHRIRLATHPTFRDFVQENNLEFFSIGGNPSELMAFMVRNPGLMPGFRSVLSGEIGLRKKDVAEYIQGCWRSCYKAGDGMDTTTESGHTGSSESDRPFVADCIIANPPSFAHIHCAEKLGIPLHIMFTMPYSPTQAFPHPLANIQSSNADPQLTNYMSYAMIDVLSWQGLGDIINRFRVKCLGLEPVSRIWAPGMLQRLKVPHTYCWSPALIPKPKDWGPHISISGFYFLGLASNFTPTPELQTFLDAGPPPVYIGFGSIVLDDPNAMTKLIFEAVRKTGCRLLLSKGWGGMGAEEFDVPDGVFMLGNVPHDWLFQHVSCVVHHGGAGTTSAGISAGRPTLVIPFFGDQPFWGAMVARAGAGPDPIPHKQLTAERLADGISFCLKPESLERAKELASKIAAERGTDVGAQSFHQYLDPDGLRCTLAPSRPAAWRIKRTEIRLSTFAACTLANANLLDFHDLKLFRSREYNTDEGPWDPLSGFSAGVFGALSNMASGIADFPSETARALQMPFGSDRKQSQASVSNITRPSQVSVMGQTSSASESPERGQGKSQTQDTLSPVPSAVNQTGPPSPYPNGSSSSPPTSMQSLSNPYKVEVDQSRLRRELGVNSSKDDDRMRRKGAHTSKGFGRIVKAGVQAPMDLSMGITKGFHNMPKMWGDDTMRPQEKVTDLKSGVRAIGREFGFGMYDGVTGLVTQPWKGAQKEGASGFLKGVGKGVGGFLAKPGAALFGIPAYMMKGVHKEVQKLYGSDVQSYIVTSRTVQGYEEWMQSSVSEKEDVIDRWTLIQKYLKKKHSPDEMMQDMLKAQERSMAVDRGPDTHGEYSTSSALPMNTAVASTMDSEYTTMASSGSQHPSSTNRPRPEITRGVIETNESTDMSERRIQDISHGDAEDDAEVQRIAQSNMAEFRHQQQRNPDYQDDEGDLRQAIAYSEIESQRHETETLEFEKQLKRVMAQSLREQNQDRDDIGWQSNMGRDDDEIRLSRGLREDDEGHEEGTAIVDGDPSVQRFPPTYDQGHLAGTTQNDFEAQQQGQQSEKTAEEKTEEQIVLEYVKKQSLLEVHHRNKGKGRATASGEEDDEEMEKALDMSRHDSDVNPKKSTDGFQSNSSCS